MKTLSNMHALRGSCSVQHEIKVDIFSKKPWSLLHLCACEIKKNWDTNFIEGQDFGFKSKQENARFANHKVFENLRVIIF